MWENENTLAIIVLSDGIEKLCLLYFHVSHLYLSLEGNIIAHTPSRGTNREKDLHHL